MKTIIEIYNMDHYPNWGKALESGASIQRSLNRVMMLSLRQY
jgi:hypothetical protein